MVVTKVSGIKKFKKGMCLKNRYSWTGEPTKEYYYKVIKPQHKGEGADVEIYKVKENGKINPNNPSIGKKAFLWDFETQIGKIKSLKGWGRVIRIKC